MTAIPITGKITALEVDDSADFEIVTIAGGSNASPATISPGTAGKRLVVVTDSASGAAAFQMEGSFAVGDVIEAYASNGFGFTIKDENGVFVAAGSSPTGVRMRKLFDTQPSPGFGTWGAT